MNTLWERELTNQEKDVIRRNKKSILKYTLCPVYKLNMILQIIIYMLSLVGGLCLVTHFAEYIPFELLFLILIFLVAAVLDMIVSNILENILYLIISSFRFWQFLNIGELYASKGRVVSYEENDVLRFFDANVIMEGNYCFIDWILSPLEMKSKPDTKELIILYKDNGICLPLYVNDETKMLYDSLKWSHDEYDMKIELDETMFNRAKLPIIPHPNAIYAKQDKRTITQEEIEVLVGRNRFSRFIFKHITAVKVYFILIIAIILIFAALYIFTDDGLSYTVTILLAGGLSLYFTLLIFGCAFFLEKKKKVEYTIQPIIYCNNISGNLAAATSKQKDPNSVITNIFYYIYTNNKFVFQGRTIPTANLFGKKNFKFGELVYYLEYVKDDGVLISSKKFNSKYVNIK